MNIKRKISASVASVGLVAAAGLGALASAAPAQAAPYACMSGGGGSTIESTGWVVCYQGSGSYRAKAACSGSIDYGVNYFYKFGPWESGGNKSTVLCPEGFWNGPPEVQFGT